MFDKLITGLIIFWRILLLLLAYGIQLASVILYICKLKSIAHPLYERGCRILTISLGINVNANNPAALNKLSNKQNYLFIANHDSITDVFIVQGYLGLRTLVDARIKSFPLPFFSYTLKQYGHYIFKLSDRSAQKTALYTAIQQLKTNKQFFIFPSSGIKPITEHCSASIYLIAKKAQAQIVPIYFDYHPRTALVNETYIDSMTGERKNKKSDLALLLNLISSKKPAKLSYSYGEAININDYNNAAELITHIKSCYRCAQ